MLPSLRKFVDRVLFGDVTPLIRLGRQKTLQIEDLPPLPAWLEPRAVPASFNRIRLGGPWRFLADVLRACGKRQLTVALLVAALIVTGILIPVAMRGLVKELEAICGNGGSIATGTLLTLAFCFLMTMQT